MTNIPPSEADSVSFEPSRDREALTGVIADAQIADLGTAAAHPGRASSPDAR